MYSVTFYLCISYGFNDDLTYILSFPGFPITTVIVMFVTYCLIQVIKERERRQALIDDPDPIPPPAPVPPPTPASASTTTAPATPTATQPVIEPGKEKAE